MFRSVTGARPAVSIVMPFAGGPAEAAEAVAALARIACRPGDERILVDNTPEPAADAIALGDVRVVRAVGERSSYHARNAGARAARNEWLLFIDADTRPAADILEAYFSPAPDGHVGALAGTVAAAADQPARLAAYARSRGYLSQAELLDDDFRPHAVTANVLVRRRAWTSVGGFAEGVRSGGDSDFSWRLQEAGWSIDARPAAAVEHAHRESLRPFLRVATRYGAGRAWLRRRWPGAFADRPGPLDATRAAVAAGRWLAQGERERAAFRAIDAAVGVADLVGEQLPNRPPAGAGPTSTAAVVVLLDAWPVLSETFIVQELGALVRAGHPVRIEAGRRPLVQALDALATAPVDYAEDDARLEKLAAAVWLTARHPLACLRDLRDRRRWAREEPVLPLRGIAPVVRRAAAQPQAQLYCHFAGPAALTTLRLARLLGRPYALTAHAHEIFREPANLVEKVGGAAVVFTGCEYNVAHLRRLAGSEAGERIHEIVMGVDAEVFTRSRPLPQGRRVIGVGRLVEKKGFADLIDAIAGLRAGDGAELVLIGDGPLRATLEQRAREGGVADRVRFLGALPPDEVRAELEQADLLAMPCVVAADGDRDSMPVVVKEAMALELLVVGTDEVGLPELVAPPWGRLVPPHDATALAAAFTELLALAPAERAAAGRAGREHVLAHANVTVETARLAALLGLA